MVNVRKEIGIDWLSVTAVPDCVDDVSDLLEMWSPRSEWISIGPGGGYGQRFKLPNGVRLELDRRDSGRFRVDVPGAACATLGSERVHQLGQTAGMGGTFTRVDVRMDLRGDSVSLVDDLAASCRAGQLRGVRSFQLWPIFNADGVRMEGDGVSLGRYGSVRLIRVYDKGLETGLFPRGTWVRWEVQLREEYAHKAGCDIFSAELSDLPTVALPHAFDLCDFRIGDRTLKPKRLPRPAWWTQLIAGVADAETGIDPRDVDLERWLDAVRDQYGRLISAVARDCRVPVGDVCEWIFSGLKPNAGTLKNPVLPLAVAAFESSRNAVPRSRS